MLIAQTPILTGETPVQQLLKLANCPHLAAACAYQFWPGHYSRVAENRQYFYQNGWKNLSTLTRTDTKNVVRNGVLSAVAAGNLDSFGMVEPGTTNKFLRSEDFRNADASWVATNVTPTDGGASTVRPGHNYTILTASGANGTFLQTVTATADSWTVSFWMRRRTGTGDIQLTADGSTWATVTLTSSWTRVSVTQTASAAALGIGIKIVTSGDAVDIDCSQYEALSWASSYVPTAEATVARSADLLLADIAALDSLKTAGTLFWIGRNPWPISDASATRSIIALSDGDASQNAIQLINYDGKPSLDLFSGNVEQTWLNTGSNVAKDTIFSLAATWTANSVKLFQNGAQAGATDASATMPTALNRIRFGQITGGSALWSTEHMLALVLDRVATDAEIAALDGLRAYMGAA